MICTSTWQQINEQPLRMLCTYNTTRKVKQIQSQLTLTDVHPSSWKSARVSPRTCMPSLWAVRRNSSVCCPYRLRGTGTAPSVTTYRRRHRLHQIRVRGSNPTGPWHHGSGTASADERTCRACAAETTTDLSYFRLH